MEASIHSDTANAVNIPSDERSLSFHLCVYMCVLIHELLYLFLDPGFLSHVLNSNYPKI